MIDFIIIGAQKGGTTAAAYNLNKHPEISVFSGMTEYGQFEIEFFNQHWDRGEQWYLNQIPQNKGIKGEKTAELLHRTICHERIYSVNPNIKLIVLLRSPIDRAFSQWRMASLNKKDELRSFNDVVFAEVKMLESESFKKDFYLCKNNGISCWREGYIIKGFYHEQLSSLFQYFPRENVHIAISEKVMKEKVVEYNRILSFLNVDPLITEYENRFIGTTSHYIEKKTYDLLNDIYFRRNQDLFNMLGYEIKEWK